MKFSRSEILDCLYPRGVIFSLQNFFARTKFVFAKLEKAESILGPCLKFYWFSISSLDSLAILESLIDFSVVFSMIPR